jgi:manganese/zinc/iron transport system substrate-binding protein
MEPNGKLKVLSTTAMIESVVSAVGGEHVDSLALIAGELDPHSYQLVKGDDEKLAFAQIVFYNGLGLEHGPSLQDYLAKNIKSVSLGDQLLKHDSKLILHYKGQLDPHIWMDISLWSKIVPNIVDVLSKQDPLHAEHYKANGAKLINEMMKTHAEIKANLQKLPSKKRYLVTSHDAFNYFARAYLAEEGESDNIWQERFAAPEGLAPDSQLSANDIQAIIDHLKKYNIHVLFPESNVSKDSIRKIMQAAREKGLNVKISTDLLYSDAMGQPGSDGDTYLKMIQHNAHAIFEGLQNNGKLNE